MYSGITSGRVLDDWREIFMKQSVGKLTSRIFVTAKILDFDYYRVQDGKSTVWWDIDP